MLLLLGACATTTEPLESQSKQKDPHLARLYFIRPAGWIGSAGTIGMKINGQSIGEIAIASYLFVDRAPGRYTLEFAPPFDWGKFQTDVQVAAGQSYYYAITANSAYAPIGHGAVVELSDRHPGTPMSSKDSGLNLTTFRLNVLDSAAGAAEVANLRAK